MAKRRDVKSIENKSGVRARPDTASAASSSQIPGHCEPAAEGSNGGRESTPAGMEDARLEQIVSSTIALASLARCDAAEASIVADGPIEEAKLIVDAPTAGPNEPIEPGAFAAASTPFSYHYPTPNYPEQPVLPEAEPVHEPEAAHWQESEEPQQAGPAPEQPARSNRFLLLAGALAAAAAVGAMVGAIAVAPFAPRATMVAAPPASSSNELQAVTSALAQMRSDVAALKVSVEAQARSTSAQLAKAADRLDRVEKAQAEPAAKLGKVMDALDRLERRSETVPAAKDTTGSLPASALPAPPAAGNVAGWSVRDVNHGVALIQGRLGLIEVEAGDVVPGLGRIESIRRQDGRWVVMTARGPITGPTGGGRPGRDSSSD